MNIFSIDNCPEVFVSHTEISKITLNTKAKYGGVRSDNLILR